MLVGGGAGLERISGSRQRGAKKKARNSKFDQATHRILLPLARFRPGRERAQPNASGRRRPASGGHRPNVKRNSYFAWSASDNSRKASRDGAVVGDCASAS